MAQLTSAKLRSLAVLDPDWKPEQIAETVSTYTQASPRPGVATTLSTLPKLDPAVVGAQEDGIVVAVLQSGYPEVGGGSIGVGYYMNDGVETISSVRGFQAPVFIADWREGPTGRQITTSPLSGKIASAAALWNPHTEAVSSLSGMATSSGSGVSFVPGTDRLLGVTSTGAFYTDDLTTWTQFATTGPADASSGTPTYGSTARSRLLPDGAGNWLYIIQDQTGDPTTDFYASDDGCASWLEIERTNLTGANALIWDAAPHPEGWIAFVKRDGVAGNTKFVRIPSAFDAMSDQDSVEIGSALTPGEVTVACDANGVIWVYLTESGAAPNTTFVYYSVDRGASFTRSEDLWPSRGTIAISDMHATAHPWGGIAASINVSGSGFAQLGGWSGPGRTGNDWASAAGGREDVIWVANSSTPTDVGFTKTGTTTDTHVATGGTAPNNYLRVQSGGGAAQGFWEDGVHTGARTEFAAEWICRITDDGGTTSATPDASGIGVRMQCRDNGGGTRKTLIVWMDEAGWRLWDEEAAAWEAAKVAVTLTARTHFRLSLTGGSTWEVQTRQDGQTKWTRTTGAGLTNGVPAADGVTARWGHLTGVANTESHWWKVAARGVAAAGLVGTSNIGIGATMYPLPDIHDTARERLSWLRVRGGPSVTGESYTIEPKYAYAAANLFPTREPSPDKVWRSTAVGSTITVAVDKGTDTDLGTSQGVAMVVRNSGTRQIRLVGRTSAGGAFATLATLDLATGFTDLQYTLEGNRLRPASGGVAARYIQRNELVGGHVVMDPNASSAGTKRRRIKSNSAGWWNASTNGPKCVIYLEPDEIDGTEDATETMHIVWPSGVLVLWKSQAATAYRYWGFEIASSEASVYGTYHQIGTVALCGVVGFGKQFDDGYQWQNVPNVRVTEDSYGTQRRQQAGPTRRVATIAWDHQTDHLQLRTGAADTNWIGPTDSGGTTPAVVEGDVWPQIRGAVIDARGGELPVCLILKGATYGAESLTDPTLWLFGFLEGEQGWEQTAGDDTEGELGRPRQIRVVEAV